MIRSRGRCIRKQLINGQACSVGNSLQQLCRGPVHAVHEIRDGRLRHLEIACQGGLTRSGTFQPVTESFHGLHMNISLAYIMGHKPAISQSYVPLPDNWVMRKQEKTFLDRAMEALADKHRGERVTQTKLAKMAGVTQPAVSDWGKGAGPELDKGIKLAMQLGVCVEWLYTGRGPKRPVDVQPTDEHLSPILQVWPELDEKTRKQIARYADFIRDDSKS